MKKRVWLTGLLAAYVSASHGADLYFDMNGTAPGFGVNGDVDPFEVNFTNLTWNTDSTGGAGGSITNVNDGDVLNFGLEGTSGILFNWTYFTNATVGGIHTYQTEGSSGTISRFQVKGNDGYPYMQLRWADGAFFNTSEAALLYWNLGTVGDFEKIGNEWLIFADGGVKLNGTCTISTNNVIIRNLGTVDSNSSFNLNGGQLRYQGGLSGTSSIGTLSGNGSIIRDGSGDLGALTISSSAFSMTNGIAGEEIKFGWGASAAMNPGAETTLDIAKIGGTNYADTINVDWGQKTLTLDGTLTVTNIGAETLVVGDAFDLFSDNLVGSFDTINLPDLGDPGLIWSTAALTASGVIEVVVADTSAPSAPTGLTAVSNLYTVALDWDNNPEPTVTGYKVYRSETSGGPWVEIADIGTSEFLDTTTIPSDITYYYQVSAYNFADVEGDAADEASTTVLFNLRNGDFELPVLAANSSTSISNSGDWAQIGDTQKIHSHTWAPESGAQGIRLEGWQTNVVNSFWQDKEGSEGIEYALDAGFKSAANFIPNGGEIDLALVWLDAEKSEISRETVDVTSTIPADIWTHFSITNTAPTGTAFVRALVEWRTDASNEVSGSTSAFVDNISLTRDSAPDPYDTWAGSWGVNIGGPNDDFADNDGVENLMEYALGGNPTLDDAADILPLFSTAPEGDWFYYIHNELTDDDTLTYTVKKKDDLAHDLTWTTDGIEYVGETAPSGGFKTVTNRTDIGNVEFLRLEVEKY